MRLLALAIATLLFVPLAGADSHSGACAQATTAGSDVDKDGDQMDDAWERKYFQDLCQGADGDYDHDGVSNLDEFRGTTNPADPKDPPREDGNNGSAGSGGNSASDDPKPDDASGDNSADNGSRPETVGQACRDADDRRECAVAYCKDHRSDKQCQAAAKEACERRECAALSAACTNATDARREKACDALIQVDNALVQAKHITFSVDRAGRELINYTVGGTVVFSSITYGGEDEAFKLKQDGARIRMQSDDARLEIQDSATGAFWFRSDEGALTMVLPEGAALTETRSGHIIDYSGRQARIAGDYHIDGQTIMAGEDFRFFIPVKNGPTSRALDDAKALGTVGLEAAVRPGASDVTAYDELDINITTPDQITLDTPLRIVVGAELTAGRTIIIDVDPALLTGPELSLRYFDVLDDGNETEVVFRMASSLEDVLDPSDDGGQPEYWIVEDASGLHVMASIPHWSIHAIELASIGEFLVQPSILIGAAAGVMGVAVASMAMFWPRRQEPV